MYARGIEDKAFNFHLNITGEKLYETYKVALILIVGKIINEPIPYEQEYAQIICKMQMPNGGVKTHFLPGTIPDPEAKENIETTCLAIYALYTIEAPSEKLPIQWASEVYDWAIVGINVSAKEVYIGQVVNISVTVENEGSRFQGFTPITFYINNNEVGTIAIICGLNPGERATLPAFIWDTKKNAIVEFNNTVKVFIQPLPNETDTADNIAVAYVYVKNDINPPNIIEVVQEPPSPEIPEDQIVNVSVRVIDKESGVRNVTLYYNVTSLNGTIIQSTTPTQMLKVSGDEYNGTYSATIPGFKNRTQVTYWIIAYDKAGNSGYPYENRNYSYHVIPEFSTLNILIPIIILTSFISYLKRRAPSSFLANFMKL